MGNLQTIIVSALAAGCFTLLTTYVSSILLERKEKRKWETETAIKYIELSLNSPELARKLSKQFAIAVLVLRNEENETVKKFFLPAFCRYTVGRSDDNDICIIDKFLSREHGLFIYNNGHIYYQDSSAKNKTQINNKEISTKKRLRDGDKIIVGKSLLTFRKL